MVRRTSMVVRKEAKVRIRRTMVRRATERRTTNGQTVMMIMMTKLMSSLETLNPDPVTILNNVRHCWDQVERRFFRINQNKLLANLVSMSSSVLERLVEFQLMNSVLIHWMRNHGGNRERI